MSAQRESNKQKKTFSIVEAYRNEANNVSRSLKGHGNKHRGDTQ